MANANDGQSTETSKSARLVHGRRLVGVNPIPRLGQE